MEGTPCTRGLRSRSSTSSAIGRGGPRVVLAAIVLVLLSLAARAGEEARQVDKRLGETAKFLASDKLEGRGLGSQGLAEAADYLAGQFKGLGLKTQLFDGAPFQKFNVTTSATLGDKNSLEFAGPPAKSGPADKPQRMELKQGKDFNPMSLGGSTKFDLP